MENLVGYRFSPTDEELINYYLKHKMLGNEFCIRDAINEVDFCMFEPCDLWRKSKIPSDNQVWYFFSRIDYKYPKSKRVNRTTNSGFWKATGKHREIRAKDEFGTVIGTKRTLVFHKGRAENGEKTDWVMHEYHSSLQSSCPMEYVICKLKYKGTSSMSPGLFDGGEPSCPSSSGSQNHPALNSNSGFNEQFQEPMDYIEVEDDELFLQLTAQFRGASSPDILFQNHSLNGHDYWPPPATFNSDQDQEIYNYEADEMSEREEFFNSLWANGDEPFYEGAHAYFSNAPKSINCITKVDKAYYSSVSSSETSPESPLLEAFSSDSESSESIAVQKPNKGGAGLLAVDLPEEKSKKDLEKQEFEDIQKRKGLRTFMKRIEMPQETYPPVVYFRNLVLGILLLLILVREAMVVH